MGRSNRGRRYEEPKLNMKKVFAVIIAFIVVIMVIFVIKGILSKNKEQGKITSKDYFAVYKDEKWGVIDQNGDMVIDPSYKEAITIPNSKKDVFLCVYDVNYETGEYKTKALNSKNEEIFTQYDKIEAIQNSDENNNLWNEENVLKVKKDDKYGIIDLTGKELSQTKYEEITAVPGIKNALKVKENEKWGIIDNQGKIIVQTNYEDIINLGKDNKSGFIVKGQDGKYGIIDYSNQTVLETKYDEIRYLSNTGDFLVQLNEKYGIVSSKKEVKVKIIYSSIELMDSDAGLYVVKNDNNKYGVIDTKGVTKVYIENDEIGIDSSKYKENEIKNKYLLADTLIPVRKGKYWGLFDKYGRQVVDYKYDSLGYNVTASKPYTIISSKVIPPNPIPPRTYTALKIKLPNTPSKKPSQPSVFVASERPC